MPYDLFLRQRIEAARDLLETTEMPADGIAAATGFGTATGFRRHFRKLVSLTPSICRERFAQSRRWRTGVEALRAA